ncbi:MAG TPA: acyltransferase [Mesorhizobium sp.]|uniref:acyltransferase n=1 Tax=Mesorhizobium sp. TaxID=1871066 RepID=UPI002DDDA379|nr:acyltransferase [Mesorhizobium sp.]HEV2504151.1 acyltransferase [Mesorhizobium sp.]
MLKTIIQTNTVTRCFRTAYYLRRGSKISPNAIVVGTIKGLSIARHVTIGARSRISLSPSAKVALSDGVWLSTDIEIETEGLVSIGARTTIQRRATVNGNVTIGKECIFAPNVFISSGTHPFRAHPDISIREQERRIADGTLHFEGLDRPVVIGDDCWLGTNAVVCPGVTIGDGCVVGANSVVTKSLKARGVYAGAPARKIGER